MNITGKTRITGLFGYPVEHSLSPSMHNAAFKHLGLDCCYLPFQVHPDFLGHAVEAIRALNFIGVNVTVPHKEPVIPFLDIINEEASFIGAVNTIVNSEGRLKGFNTDGRGFMRSLSENNIAVKGKKILVVGAGGASRAISYYISEKAALLNLFDIDNVKLAKLVSDLSRIRTNVSGISSLDDLKEFEIIINATPLGLGKEDPLPFAVDSLTPEHTVCDLIYKKTPVLEQASQKGCKTMDGLGMLLWQGVFAFELWTSAPAPVDVMKNALLNRISRSLA
ncbi:MAG: shikimate dehydrogenase [Nitrospirota bacterium]